MERADENSLTEVMEEPLKEDAPLDLIDTRREELVGKRKVRGSTDQLNCRREVCEVETETGGRKGI